MEFGLDRILAGQRETEISDEEVLQRDADLESGQAEEISHEEFIRRVERERGR